MAQGVEHIGKRDVAWSYAATFFLIGAGLLLLPFILRQMSAEAVGIWNIFQTITMLVSMLDFGFQPSFSRNISYIFSGVRRLRKEGVESVNPTQSDGLPVAIDYGLLKGTLKVMRRFYRWVALAAFVLLATAGTAYFVYILRKYSGGRTDAIVAWALLISINCYNLYTLYYDALLVGKGYIRRSKQITIIGQGVYLLLAVGLIYAGLGLSAIVAAQLVSIIIRRVLSYRVFYTRELKKSLSQAQEGDTDAIIRAIYPNAIKVGLTHLGNFAVSKSATLIGAIYLSLEDMACYGLTLQVLEILCNLSNVPYKSFVPKLAQCRAEKDIRGLRRYYLINELSLLLVYSIGGVICVAWGNAILQWIDSQTLFLPAAMFTTLIVIHFLEENHASAAGFIMADNKIPIFIPSLISGAATIVLLWLFLDILGCGIWGMILAPGIAQLAYQNWRWPSMLIKELWFDV